MGVVGGASRGMGRLVGHTAAATTSAAGAVGGAAVNGVVGAVTGAAEGVKRGLSKGSKSTPAAALAIGALGVAGLVEWPILLALGGGALLLRKMNSTPKAEQSAPPRKAKLTTVPTKREPDEAESANDVAPRKTAAKKTTGRRGTAELRSTN